MIEFNLQKALSPNIETFDFDLRGTAQDGEIVAIHGISGVGKTTLLKMIAGLITPDSGTVSVNGSQWFDSDQKINIATRNRDLGFLFQDYALFPNMTVLQNLQYAMTADSDPAFADRVIEITELGDLLAKSPNKLSGGQKQRVAFARSVMRKPSLLLLDEPLSALDAALRSVLQNELLELRKLLDVTILFTSHSISEVYKLADKVLLIEGGRITKEGTPSDVFAVGDDSVDAIGELLSSRLVGDKRVMNILVDGKVVAVNVDEAMSK